MPSVADVTRVTAWAAQDVAQMRQRIDAQRATRRATTGSKLLSARATGERRGSVGRLLRRGCIAFRPRARAALPRGLAERL
ncbi:MAG: hypothetical protein AUG75_18985 [Cyanobacteria bacterium 13_1_20CM_4_61_6]|nr:MAG: hypothetical protein AUG75_18985 [Cyanobacteria bacterium 13_1_20CM_4_61_6]